MFHSLQIEQLGIHGKSGRPRVEDTLRGRNLSEVMEQVADAYCTADSKVRANILNPDLTTRQLTNEVNEEMSKRNPYHNKPFAKTTVMHRTGNKKTKKKNKKKKRTQTTNNPSLSS